MGVYLLVVDLVILFEELFVFVDWLVFVDVCSGFDV